MNSKPHHNAVPLWVMNLTAFCLIMTGSLFLVERYASQYRTSIITEQIRISRELPSPEALLNNPYAKLSLEAKSAVVFDATQNKVIYGLNEELQLPLASITKLMTALVATETLPSYTAIPIVDRDVEYDPRLKVGETWTLRELLAYTLLTSSNTGADSAAVATAAFLDGAGTRNGNSRSDSFISAMNEKAQSIGLTQTYFLNGNGLDTHAKVSGAYGSASDMARLLKYILDNHPYLTDPTREVQIDFVAPDGRSIEAFNTNANVDHIPGIIGSKTGLTDLAGGNLAIAFDASFGQPYIVVVLGSSQEGRFSDVEELINATITYLGSNLWGAEKVETEETTPQ